MELLDLKSQEAIEFIDRIEKISSLFKETLARRKPQLNGERFLTNNDLRKILHISERTLQEYRDTGMLPYIKITGKILYKESDVLKVLEENYYHAFNK